ncbi:programmed cell death protein 2-like [Alosa pseudoharengus]|uniref:programmed cell death protein 2-like n=1 Tax=Alosa sapidissima TaxID=34773 RepID=UPI001C0A2322|nr:programmed cell death protein 2-like [Alosa sapidissima]XP_048093353.1 programmed cell death protein 2-like [Alosa alosa]
MATPHENPLIGLRDGAIDDKRGNLSTFLTNKVGGEPDLLPAVSLEYPRCSLCSSSLSHVVQVYCPLDASPYHRTINVFACTNSDCHGKSDSWRVLRSQCLESDIKSSTEGLRAEDPAVQQAPMASTDWCDDADDWGEEEDGGETWTASKTQTLQNATVFSTEAAPDVSSQLQSLSISSTEDPQLKGPMFQPFYVSVVEESDFAWDSGMEHAKELLREYEQREGATAMDLGGEGGGGEERYEKTEARHGDAVFTGFMKRISLCPEQVLRYCRNSSPLFISKPPLDVKQIVPPCCHCGSSRTFEFQLMPALVSLLCMCDPHLDLAVEFGTVLVYTCQSSCWISGSNSPMEEFAFVQADPDQKHFK